jgi:hypothetical protein
VASAAVASLGWLWPSIWAQALVVVPLVALGLYDLVMQMLVTGTHTAQGRASPPRVACLVSELRNACCSSASSSARLIS